MWKTDGLKVMSKVMARLNKWKGLLLKKSYRGTVLIINKLVASMLEHKLDPLPRSIPEQFLTLKAPSVKDGMLIVS